jgi:hypothetical protein
MSFSSHGHLMTQEIFTTKLLKNFASFFYRSQQVESSEIRNVVEIVKCDYCFMHILDDPFAILLEEVNNPGPSIFLRIGLVDKILNESSTEGFSNKQVQRKQTTDKILSWLHWDFLFHLINSPFFSS